MQINHRFTKYLHPIIAVITIVLFVFLFLFFAITISKFIDNALEQEQKIQTYRAEEEIPKQKSILATTTEIQTATSSILIEKKPPENKSLITIAIFNSTTKQGEAAELSALLATHGYKISFTGNEKKQEQMTLIKIKDTSKKIFPESFQEITEIVGRRYSPIDLVLDANSEYDAIIIIGIN